MRSCFFYLSLVLAARSSAAYVESVVNVSAYLEGLDRQNLSVVLGGKHCKLPKKLIRNGVEDWDVEKKYSLQISNQDLKTVECKGAAPAPKVRAPLRIPGSERER